MPGIFHATAEEHRFFKILNEINKKQNLKFILKIPIPLNSN